jgi:hypothetical protein
MRESLKLLYRSLDICRAGDCEHDLHGPANQEAFRQIVRAMPEQSG